MSGGFGAAGLAVRCAGSPPFSDAEPGRRRENVPQGGANGSAGEIVDLDDQSAEPADLCITQARYTQLHRLINNSQGRYSFIM